MIRESPFSHHVRRRSNHLCITYHLLELMLVPMKILHYSHDILRQTDLIKWVDL